MNRYQLTTFLRWFLLNAVQVYGQKTIREESSTVRGGTVGTPVTNYVLD